MTESKTSWLHWVIVAILWSSLILTGCKGGAHPSESSASVTTTSPSIAVTATNQPLPTDTPLSEKVVLVTTGMDENIHADLALTLTKLAAENSLLLEEYEDLQTAKIAPDWRLVVLMAPDSGLSEMLTANPATQFIVYSDQALTSSSNLNVIHIRRDRQAFVAGYLSTIITPDWRAAGLFPPGAEGDIAEQAFINGGEYLCGLCDPYYAPLVLFPLSGRVSGADEPSIWQADLDALLANIIYTVYVSPESESQALWDVLNAGGQILVGSGSPPQALADRWAASVMLDMVTPLQELWPDVMAGVGGKMLETPVKLANINENYLTPGKKLRLDEVIDGLENGWIEPLDIPE